VFSLVSRPSTSDATRSRSSGACRSQRRLCCRRPGCGEAAAALAASCVGGRIKKRLLSAGQTNEQTEGLIEGLTASTRSFDRPCTAYYASSVNNHRAKSNRLTISFDSYLSNKLTDTHTVIHVHTHTHTHTHTPEPAIWATKWSAMRI